MHLAEIRDLDGPNLFMLGPAIKVEVVLDAGETEAVLAERLQPAATDLTDAAATFVRGLHEESGQPLPAVSVHHLDTEGHVAIVFGWSHRQFALTVADRLVHRLSGVADDNITSIEIRVSDEDAPDDAPALIRDSDRSALAISVTGTNGKTTTTRLIAHLMRSAGYLTGWNSSSGIYVDGVEIEAGDYSGPSGARRVLQDPSVQVAVLETARGGILLRGLGYEHNDVSVFTNISPDHLDLQGVRTLETLARVKAVVCRVTKPDGVIVVNADDPQVMSAVSTRVASRTLFSRNPDNPAIADHLRTGGTVVLGTNAEIEVWTGGKRQTSLPYSDIPMTFNGRARHMVENAMAGVGAALGAGLPISQIREGLRTFENDPEHNPGRLNLYRLDGRTVVLDFAHNEAGLLHLLEFGRGELGDGGRLITIIGTAGDRTDESLFEIGRLAAEQSDFVIAKGTTKYLRGRELQSLMDRYRAGAQQHPSTPYSESGSEVTALRDALDIARDGDVIVMMVQEHIPELEPMLRNPSAE